MSNATLLRITGAVRWFGAASAIAGAIACASLLVGCTGDSGAAALPVDAGADQTTIDAGDVVDAATPDAGVVADAAAEAAVDAAPDGFGTVAPTCVPYDAAALDATAVEAGAALVQTLTPTCAFCHDTDYRGNVPVTAGAYSKNLTPDPATGLGCWTDPQIVAAILYGETPEGGHLCVMPQWSQRGMDAGQAEEIVQFLRSLPPVVNEVMPTDCDDIGDGAVADAPSDAPMDAPSRD